MNQKCSQNSNEREIKENFVEFIKEVKTKIDAWFENESDVRLEIQVEKSYLNVSRYDPLVARTSMALLKKLQHEKAMINVQNRRADNECLKWSLQINGVLSRAEGRNPLRTTINYAGICFPTPMKDLEKLGVQHDNIAINFFWLAKRQTDCVQNKRKSNSCATN